MLLVKSILSSVAQLARLGRRSEPTQSVAGQTLPTAAGPSSAGSALSDAMRQIVAEYDVANISPRALSEMLQKLRQAGALSDKDFQELSSIRLDLDNEGVGLDERINLVERYAKKLGSIREQRDANPAVRQATQASLQRQLAWLQKSVQIRTGTSPLGFDTLA